jgi:hypothetical protein
LSCVGQQSLSIGRLPEFPSQGANQSTSLRLNQGMKAQRSAPLLIPPLIVMLWLSFPKGVRWTNAFWYWPSAQIGVYLDARSDNGRSRQSHFCDLNLNPKGGDDAKVRTKGDVAVPCFLIGGFQDVY